MSPSGLAHRSVSMSHTAIHTVSLCWEIFLWRHTQGMRRREASTANTDNHNSGCFSVLYSGGWLFLLVLIVHISGGQCGVNLQFFTLKWLLLVSMANQINRLTRSVTPLKEKAFTIWFSSNKKNIHNENSLPRSSDIDEHLSTWKTWAEGHTSPQKVRETWWTERSFLTTQIEKTVFHMHPYLHTGTELSSVSPSTVVPVNTLVISSPTNGERGKGGANCFVFFSFDPSQRQQWQNSYPESTRGKPNILKADDNRVSFYCYCLCSFSVTGALSSSGNRRPVWNWEWDTFLSGQMKVTVLYQAAVTITGHTRYVLTTL